MPDRFDAPPIPADLALPEGEEPPPTDEEVDAFLDAQAGEAPQLHGEELGRLSQAIERVKAFRLTDDDRAEWYMRQLAAAEVEVADIARRAAAWREQVDAWEAGQTKAIERRSGWWRAHLEDYAVRRRAARLAVNPRDPRAKTLALPSGRVSTASPPPNPRIADPEAVLAWLRARAVTQEVDPEEAGWIKVTTVPVAAKVKGLLMLKGSEEKGYQALCDGEVVPGIEVDASRVTATVKPL